MLGLVLDLFSILLRDRLRARGKRTDHEERRRAFDRVRPFIREQYAAWAKERGLSPGTSADLFCGSVSGCAIHFDTGLGGDTEHKPMLDLARPLDIDDALLVERGFSPSTPDELRAHALLERVELLEKVWLSRDGLRLVFEKRAHPDVFDAALEAVLEDLRGTPYR